MDTESDGNAALNMENDLMMANEYGGHEPAAVRGQRQGDADVHRRRRRAPQVWGGRRRDRPEVLGHQTGEGGRL
eukprot:scaffold62460_cov34-Phaeocystis_antarctica.AAC.2